MKWLFITIQIASSLVLLGAISALAGRATGGTFLFRFTSTDPGMAYSTAVMFLLVGFVNFAISSILLWLSGTILALKKLYESRDDILKTLPNLEIKQK